MSWKSTLLLVLLAAAAGVWVWKGDAWLPNAARRGVAVDPPAIEAALTPDAITRVEVLPASGESFVLERGPGGWSQPGNWPLRAAEVNELIDTLAALRTRFQPIPPPADADLAAYGLAGDPPPLVVKVRAGADYTLAFGEPKPESGDTPFTRPAYVRVNGGEVLRLGPDVLPVLRRPAEAYRRRQLFAAVERVRLAAPASPLGAGDAPATVSLPGEDIEEIRVGGKGASVFGLTPWFLDGRFALKRTGPTPAAAVAAKGADPVLAPDRLADAWAVSAPVRDRPDPDKLRQALAAVPELWVEDFVPAAQRAHPADPFVVSQFFPAPGQPLPALAAWLHPEVIPDPRAELKEAKERVTVRLKGGNEVTVVLGRTAKVTEREEMRAVPSPMGGPPQTRPEKVATAYRYAQLAGNPQLFTVGAEKLPGLFVRAGDLVDASVARFAKDDVQAVTVAVPGRAPLALTRKKGSPKAEKEEDRQDRWVLEGAPNPLPADAARVDDLLAKLAGFRAGPDTDLYAADAKAKGLDEAAATAVTVTVRDKRPEGEPEAPARALTVLIGKPDLAKGKLPVRLAGWPRVALVDDRIAAGPPAGWLGPVLFPERVSALFARPAVAYRGRKLLDAGGAALVSVSAEGASPFALAKEKAGERDAWKLTAPIASEADPAAVANLVTQLTGLQATEFVAEKPANVAEYGLDKPKLTVRFAFDDGRRYALEVGGPRPGKPGEAFARLDGGDVFALPAGSTDGLAAGPVGLLPLRVWAVTPDKVTSAEVTRPDAPAESFALTKDGTNWALTGPFTAPVPFLAAQPALTGLGSLTASRYESLTPGDPAKYGFDKPFARVKLAYLEKVGDVEKALTQAVVIGGVTPGGADRYAKRDEPNAPVFVLPAAYLAAVRTSPLGLLDRNLLFLDAAKITKVQIGGGKAEDAVTLLKDAKGTWTAEGVGFAVDAGAAGQLASALSPLPVEAIAAYGDAVKWSDYGLEKPEFVLTASVGGDKPAAYTVRIGGPAPGGGRFVRVDDGKAVGVLAPAAVPLLARARLDFADRGLLAFDPATLTGFARTKGNEQLELSPSASGAGWDVVKPAKGKADAPLMDELAEGLGRLRAERVAAFGKKAEVFPPFGLEPPAVTVALTVGEKAEQKVLRLGRPVDAARPDGDRFAAVEGAGADVAVGVLPAALANRLLAPPLSFRDRTLAKFVDADKLELVRGGRKVTFAKVGGSWKMTAPVTADAEQGALDDFVNDLAKLRAADWVAEKPADLSPFGRVAPEATWTVSNGAARVLTLEVVRVTPEGRVYATAGAGGPVALLGRDQSARVLAEYRARRPWALDASQADKVEIVRGGKTFTLRKRGDAWLDPDAPGAAVSGPAVNELLGTLTGLQAERYAADAAADLRLFGLEAPGVVLAVTTPDGRRELAVGGIVGGTDGTQRYARVAEPGRADVFVLSAADTARLTRDRGVYVPK